MAVTKPRTYKELAEQVGVGPAPPNTKGQKSIWKYFARHAHQEVNFNEGGEGEEKKKKNPGKGKTERVKRPIKSTERKAPRKLDLAKRSRLVFLDI